MLTARRALIEAELADAAHVLERLAAAEAAPIAAAAGALVEALGRGGTVWVFGNGGSAACAQHFAAELVGRFRAERRGLPAVALGAEASVATAIANDFGFERVFARQIEALARAGDVAVGLTTSGRSPNVVAALEAARAKGLTTIALTGRDGGAAGRAAGMHVAVPEVAPARVQEAHLAILHVLCRVVDEELT